MSGRRIAAVAVSMAVLAVGGCTRAERAGPPEPDERVVPVDTELIAALEPFDACDGLLDYLRTEGQKVVGPHGLAPVGVLATTDGPSGVAVAQERASDSASSPAAPAPAAGADGFSGTNVQEKGVDEPDVVKTDGRRLFTVAGGRLRVLDVTAEAPRVVGDLSLGDDLFAGDLLLHGDRLLVLRTTYGPPSAGIPRPVPQQGVAAGEPFRPTLPGTAVTVVDVADPARPEIVSQLSVEGTLVAARMLDGVARLVVRSAAPAIPFVVPNGGEASTATALEANREAVADSTLDDWLPTFVQDGEEPRRLTDCRDVRRPESFGGIETVSVFTLDPADPRPGPAATVVGAGETVYASASSLYVTTSVWAGAARTIVPGRRGATTTDIHKFDIRDAVRTTYVASGRVGGRLVNSFALSELGDDLRVAWTDDAAEESTVSVLRQRDAALQSVGSVGGLGKTERIFAVRFLGDRAYVVTFRQTDPLYVVDLSDATAPTVRGELKIPGYSAYLHPVGPHRLLGVGQDADDQGRVRGLQLSLFDVSDPADPRRVATANVPGGNSEAEFDHHAFLWWAPAGLAVVPVHSYTDAAGGATGFAVEDAAVRAVGSVVPVGPSPIRRSVVVGARLLSLSDDGVVTSDLTTMQRRSDLRYG